MSLRTHGRRHERALRSGNAKPCRSARTGSDRVAGRRAHRRCPFRCMISGAPGLGKQVVCKVSGQIATLTGGSAGSCAAAAPVRPSAVTTRTPFGAPNRPRDQSADVRSTKRRASSASSKRSGQRRAAKQSDMRRAIASKRSDKRRAKSSRPPRTGDPQIKLVALPAVPVLLSIRFCGPVGASAWRVVRGTAAAVRYVKPPPAIGKLASAFRASRGAKPGAELGRALSARPGATKRATELARRKMTGADYSAHHIVASNDRRAALSPSRCCSGPGSTRTP